MGLNCPPSTSIISPSAIITAAPLTIGFWYYPRNAGLNGGGITLNDPTNFSGMGFFIYQNGGTYSFQAGSTDVANAGAITANKWTYILARANGVANRWMSVLDASGSVASGQNTVSVTPTGIAWTTINAYADNSIVTNYGDGIFAEFFIANADVQGDGAQTKEALIRKLAYEGPWSIPHLAPNILEYHSFRRGYNYNKDDDDFGKSMIYYTNNGAVIGAHPPLAPGYRRPSDSYLNLVV